MKASLRKLLEESGISEVFRRNNFEQSVQSDGANIFTYKTLEFIFHKSRFHKNLIYCEQNITRLYGNILPEWKRELNPDELQDLRKKLEDIYIPITRQIKFPLDISLEEMKYHLIEKFHRIGYIFFEEYSGNKFINIDYKRPEYTFDYFVFAFIKQSKKVVRVLVDKITSLIYIDLLLYPENVNNPRIIKPWYECMDPFVSKYELFDGIVKWVENNENKIEI